jgi:peroxiredoxin
VISAGDKAPDFKLKDQFGREVTLAQFAGKRNVMLLFYPLDWTPT